jgi:GTP pyrophosphokinase
VAPIPSEFDDYIARPKANDYRSLHTAVVGPEGHAGSADPHPADARAGRAGRGRALALQGRQGRGSRLRPQDHLDAPAARAARDGEADGLAGALDAELVEDRVYALTPKGEVLDLPQGATPLDFAYHVHTMVGHRCRGAKVNGRIVPLTYRLRSGDRVEDPDRQGGRPAPRLADAGQRLLASARSRNKVRSWFHKLDRARNVQAGRELLERELRGWA